MKRKQAMRLTKVFLFVGCWVFLVFLVLLGTRRIPKTAFGWACLVVAGPAFYLGAEGIGEYVFCRKQEGMESRSRFSVLRMAVAFLVVVLIILGGIIVDSLFR